VTGCAPHVRFRQCSGRGHTVMDLPNWTFRAGWRSAAVPGQPPELRRCPRSSENRQMSMSRPVRARTWRPPLPRPAGSPDAAEAGPRVARAGRAAIRSQHPSSLRARPGRSPPLRGELTFRTPTRHRAPQSGTRKDPDPRRRSSLGSGLRLGMSARRWRLRERRRPVPSQRLPGAMVSGVPAVL
jgi:hypothetical protein